MKNTHLTDDILQAYLLKEIQSESITTHLKGCSICREKLMNYQYLIESIKLIEPETFSFDVTSNVMQKIVQYESKEKAKKNFIFWGLLTIVIVVILSFSFPYISKLLHVFYSLPFFTKIFLIGTSLAVLLFLLADIRGQYSLKEKKIFGNKLQPIF